MNKQDCVRRMSLNDGNSIPQIGFGVYLLWEYEACKKAVLEALALGYRHIDTAQLYRNERAVGDAIRESGIPREEIYITTKIWITDYGYEKAKVAIEKSLNRMKIEYIDLMLLHQKFEDYIGAWKALEEGVLEGKLHSIGVSNFNIKRTQEILVNYEHIKRFLVKDVEMVNDDLIPISRGNAKKIKKYIYEKSKGDI